MQISGLPSTFLISQAQLGQGSSDHAAEQLTCDAPRIRLIDIDLAWAENTLDEFGFADLLQQDHVALPPDSLALGWSQARPILLHSVEQSDPSALAATEIVPQAVSLDPPLRAAPVDLPVEMAFPDRAVFAGVAQYLAVEAETLSGASSMEQKSGGRDAKAESGQRAEETMTGRNIFPTADRDRVLQEGSDQSTSTVDGPRPMAFTRLDGIVPDPGSGSRGQAPAQETISPAPARSAIGPTEIGAHLLVGVAHEALPIDPPARELKLAPIGGNADRGSIASITNPVLPVPRHVFPVWTLEQALPRIGFPMSIAPMDTSTEAASAAGDIKPVPLSGLLPSALFLHFTLDAAPKEETSPPSPDVGTEAAGGEVHVPSLETQLKTSDRFRLPAILSPLFHADRDEIWSDQGMSAWPEVQSGPGQVSVHGGGKASAPILAQITPQLVERIAQGATGTTTVTLSPEEFGHVRMSFQPDAQSSDQIVVMLTFDRAETMDLFRRHADQLAEALRTAGYSAVQLGFGGPGSDGFRQSEGENPSAHSAMGEAAIPDANFAGAAPTERVGLGGLDLRL